MSTATKQWILNQCRDLNIPAVGTNAHLLSLINKASRAKRQLMNTTTATVEMPRRSLLLQQFVRVIVNGNSYDGLFIRNRTTWKYQIMQGGRVVIDFDGEDITKIEYRGNRWMAWVQPGRNK